MTRLILHNAFLDVMVTKCKTMWKITVNLNTIPMEFKLDTGAAVTAILEEVFKTLPMIQLQKPSKLLSGPARQKLNVLKQLNSP